MSAEDIEKFKAASSSTIRRKTPVELFMNDLRMVINTIENSTVSENFDTLTKLFLRTIFHSDKKQTFSKEDYEFILDNFSDIIMSAIRHLNYTYSYASMIKQMMIYCDQIEAEENKKEAEEKEEEKNTEYISFLLNLNDKIRCKFLKKLDNFLNEYDIHEKRIFLSYSIFFADTVNFSYFSYETALEKLEMMHNIVIDEHIDLELKHRAADFVQVILTKVHDFSYFQDIIETKISKIWKEKNGKIDMITKVIYMDIQDRVKKEKLAKKNKK